MDIYKNKYLKYKKKYLDLKKSRGGGQIKAWEPEPEPAGKLMFDEKSGYYNVQILDNIIFKHDEIDYTLIRPVGKIITDEDTKQQRLYFEVKINEKTVMFYYPINMQYIKRADITKTSKYNTENLKLGRVGKEYKDNDIKIAHGRPYL
jgi:hypothetical protein